MEQGYTDNRYLKFHFQEPIYNNNNKDGIEVKFRCPELELDFETNDIRFSIPRYKEETNVDIKFTPVSKMAEETHYKAQRNREEFHPSCWYKSKLEVSVDSKPYRYVSTMYLIPKDDSYMSEVEFWMTGKKRRNSAKEGYFHWKVTPEMMEEHEDVFRDII